MSEKDTEKWEVNYWIRHEGRDIKLGETLRLRKGYHDELYKHWRVNEVSDSERYPFWYFTTGPIGFELEQDDFIELPIFNRDEYSGAELIVSKDRPFELIAPDGEEYRLEDIKEFIWE